MTGWLIWLVTAEYLGIALSFAFKRDPGSALMYGSYALANLGFLLHLRQFT